MGYEGFRNPTIQGIGGVFKEKLKIGRQSAAIASQAAAER
jgi:hypothetical protein